MQDIRFKRNSTFRLRKVRKVTGILAMGFLLAAVISQPALSQSARERPEDKTTGFLEKVIEEKTTAREFPKIEQSLIKTRDTLKKGSITKENARERGARQISTPLIRIDDEARIQVYVYVTSTSEQVQTLLRRHGLEIEITDERLGIIQGWIPEDALEAVARLPFVKKIAPPSYGTPRAGSVTTEGDSILLANELRALGFDGTGVRLGVISDGVNNMADSEATGDLPSDVTVFGVCGSPTTCNEGTAMLEIVHDLSPGTELAFGATGGTSLGFIARVDDLVNFGADIIVDDVGFFGEPYFEDGPVADRVQEATEVGVVYVSAAGNDGEVHYEAEYVDTAPFHDFGLAAGGASDRTMNVLLAGGASLTVFLQWNDEFGASGNDYDLLLLDDSETLLLASSESVQDGNDDPSEALIYTNPLNGTIRVKVVIRRFSGSARQLEMFLIGAVHGITYLIEEYATSGGSIFGHPAVSGAIAVGAISAGDDGHDTIELFSSQGPSEIYFPDRETRQKPDIAAIDGVSVTGVGGFSNPFSGTSAAAPHVAGLAALLMEVSPAASPEEIRNTLRNSAVDLGDPGFDNIFGAGRADVHAAAGLLNVAPESTIDEPASNITIEVDESATFSGTCTDANNTQGMSFSWDFGGGAGITFEEDPGAVVFGSTGTFTVTFTCTDGFEIADASPATRMITVVEPTVSPVIPAPATPSEDPAEPSPTEPEEPASSSPASGGCSLIL